MGIHDDHLKDGTFVERPEITENDYKKWCVRCTKELWVDFTKDVVKPCNFSTGRNINDYDGFFKYVEDINNNIKRDECNYCHIKDPEFRLLGNELWLTPGRGNSHTEFTIVDKFDKDLLEKYVKYIAKDYYKFACICITNDEPGHNIIEQNHIELIAKPFFEANRLKHRRLRYDFRTELNYSTERTVQIISYMKEMQKKYPTVDINIQPSEKSLNNNFDKKISLFIDAGFEIVVRTEKIRTRLEDHFKQREKSKMTIDLHF